jgi:hypothetical protein
MKTFSETVQNKQHFLSAIDLVAQRADLENFEHLEILIQSLREEQSLQEQLLHLACRYDNVKLLYWLLKHEELKEYLDKKYSAIYTPLLTATFYNAKNCVDYLLKV